MPDLNRKQPKKEKTIRLFGAQIPADVAQKAKVALAQQDKTVRSFILDSIDQLLVETSRKGA